MFGLGAPELIVILVIILVLFGPKRLPELGKSLGKTMKALREGAEGTSDDDETAGATVKDATAEAKSSSEE